MKSKESNCEKACSLHKIVHAVLLISTQYAERSTQYKFSLPMSYFDHHNLIYFQKAKQGTKEIVALFGHLSGNKTSEVLYKQILRSSSSIGANIAEGYGRNSKKEFKQFLGIARGSALETEYWLEIIQETLNTDTKTLIDLNKEVIKLLTTTIKNLGLKP